MSIIFEEFNNLPINELFDKLYLHIFNDDDEFDTKVSKIINEITQLFNDMSLYDYNYQKFKNFVQFNEFCVFVIKPHCKTDSFSYTSIIHFQLMNKNRYAKFTGNKIGNNIFWNTIEEIY